MRKLFAAVIIFITGLFVELGTIKAAEFHGSFNRPTIIPTPIFNPLTPAKIELGRQLFHDKRLSGGNSISCASCHQPEFVWTDRKRFSVGEAGTPRPRRTPSLQDIAWNKLFARDGRVETLEGFILGPIAHPKEMNQLLDELPGEIEATGEYSKLYRQAFSESKISLDGIVQSLASYVRTLRSDTTPFDRWIAGDQQAFNEDMRKGFALFKGKAGCINCHSGWRFSDQEFHDIGLKSRDIGRGNIEPDEPHLKFAFKTTSLRNVALHAPYMHDGSIPTLGAVIDHYQGGVVKRNSISEKLQSFMLSAQEKSYLVAFLHSLTDDRRRHQNVPLSPNILDKKTN